MELQASNNIKSLQISSVYPILILVDPFISNPSRNTFDLLCPAISLVNLTFSETRYGEGRCHYLTVYEIDFRVIQSQSRGKA